MPESTRVPSWHDLTLWLVATAIIPITVFLQQILLLPLVSLINSMK